MYNEKILNQLDNLKYLGALKGSNITVVSKPNEFSDTVKFYAQIDKDEVIQKIMYRASGCTHFLVFCNYFCSLVEGKSLSVALNVKADKLQKFVELDESKIHIVSIIIDAFALLAKRYRKGIENSKISPCESVDKVEDVSKTRPMTAKAFTKVVGEIMKNIELSNNKADNQIAVSKNTETLNRLVELKNNAVNKNDVKLVEENKTDLNVISDSQKEDVNNVDEVKREDIINPENKKISSKKASNKDKASNISLSKEIDKDEPLENLLDEGIFLDDLISNSNESVKDDIVEESVIKPKKSSTKRKLTKKSNSIESVQEISVEKEQTIEEINQEITGLIDVIENDELSKITEDNSLIKIEETETIVEKKITKKDNTVKKAKQKSAKPENNKDEKVVEKSQVAKNDISSDNASKQSNSFLALKSMINSRNSAPNKSVEEKKTENKLNNLNAMLNKIHTNDIKKDTNLTKNQDASKQDKSEDKLSSLKMSLANIRTNNDKKTTLDQDSVKTKTDKENKSKEKDDAKKSDNKKDLLKSEKTKKVENVKQSKEGKKTDKIAKKNEDKKQKDVAVKKSKKKDYDMDYEAFDDSEKKGFFSWLKRK